jgi:3',5'-cyclic-nucleotide phosphodiesterase
MQRIIFLLLLCISVLNIDVKAQHASAVFKIVPLGVLGGSDESNLSSYMIAVNGTNDYICLDAGTIYAGVQKAVDAKVFDAPVTKVIRQYIKGYCISHGHLDHSAGLIMNSPEDSSKNIYALPYTIDVLKSKYFTWSSWANFADSGEAPQLKKYHYQTLSAGIEMPLSNTKMTVKAFPLSHVKPYQSTAFLIGYQNNYVLYLGDTGADSVEHADNLSNLWQAVAPLIKAKQLKAISIETSFPDEQPVKSLFGHLTPALLMREMNKLAALCGKENIKDLPIIIAHIKPVGDNPAKIHAELEKQNNLQLKLVYPQQAVPLYF